MKNTKSDTAKITLMNQWCEKYSRAEPQDAFQYCAQALELAKKANNTLYLAESHFFLGKYYKNQNKFPEALNNYFKALKLYEQLRHIERLGDIYKNIGNIYYMQDRYVEALNYYKKFLELSQKNNNPKKLADAYNNIGNVYYMMDQYDSTLHYYLKNIDIKEKLANKSDLIYPYANLGGLYIGTKKYNKAIEYFKKSLNLSLELNNKEAQANAYSNIAVAYTKQKDYKNALHYELKAHELLKEAENLSFIKFSHEHLSLIYEKLNEPTKALEHYKIFNILKDSIFNLESSGQIAEMQTKYETEKKEQQIVLQQQQLEKERVIKYSVAGGAFMLFMLAGLLYNRYRVKHKANQKLAAAYSVIEEKNKDITDSIVYAQRIQQAILVSHEELNQVFNEAFVLNMPKDIISGDFYWVHRTDSGKIIFAVADCTGHGVPGALMSMIGNALLNEAVIEHRLQEPAEILNYLREGIIRSFKEKGITGETKDGMDMALCTLTPPSKGAGGILNYAGAYNPLYIITNGELIETKADRQPVGYYTGEKMPFTSHTIEVRKGDIIYLFSDGYPDQFGGHRGKKMGYKKFKELLINNAALPMQEQQEVLLQTFKGWKGNELQIDDVLIMGVRV